MPFTLLARAEPGRRVRLRRGFARGMCVIVKAVPSFRGMAPLRETVSWLLQGTVPALLACSFVTAAHAWGGNERGITLDEIQRRLTEWRASFVNLRIVWETRSLPETNEAVGEWPAPPDANSSKLFARNEWIWADHGLDLLEDQSFFDEAGNCEQHTIEVFNGPKGVVFRAYLNRPPGGPEEFRNLEILGLGVGKPVSWKERLPIRGLYWPGNAAWLPDKLAEWHWRLEEIETIDGEPCARIVTKHPGTPDTDFTDILWLDLNHNCLVRRFRSPTIEGKRSGRDFIVDEFQRLDGDLWFPKRGRIQLGNRGSGPNENQLFVVTEAAVNQSLDPARFEPPTPRVGTSVSDHGRTYRYGVSNSSGSKGANGNSTAVPAAPGNSIGRVAPPRPGWHVWSIALATISVLFLILGSLLAYKNRKEDAK